MLNILLLNFLLFLATDVMAQGGLLTLDSCRARALRANKQIGMARVKQQMAENVRKSARTKYLPHVDLAGGYMYSSHEISLLSDAQKSSIGSIGSTAAEEVRLLPGDVSTNMQGMAQTIEVYGNELGQRIVDAFSTNTHHLFTASAVLVQPIFMGGAIVAGNKIADIAERVAQTDIDAKQSDVTYAVDNAYWTVVSLRHKLLLADDYLTLVQKLDNDVNKMIKEGVATRADGLKVDVAVNEAEMTKTKVENALSLAKMFLCEQCGMSLDSDITLADETKEDLDIVHGDNANEDYSYEERHELRMLNDAIEISRQQTKIARAAYMPQFSLMGGAFFTNPSVYNGFERKFKGAFNVGVMMKVPVLDWGDNAYKIKATKCATNLAQLTYDEVHDKIELQVSQSKFKVNEANKNLVAAKKNIQSAEENLRCANVGFREGVMNTTDVMAAQTAWLNARTQKIDAEIDVKLSEIALDKAIGRYGK